MPTRFTFFLFTGLLASIGSAQNRGRASRRFTYGAWLYQLDGGNWFYNTLNHQWERAG